MSGFVGIKNWDGSYTCMNCVAVSSYDSEVCGMDDDAFNPCNTCGDALNMQIMTSLHAADEYFKQFSTEDLSKRRLDLNTAATCLIKIESGTTGSKADRQQRIEAMRLSIRSIDYIIGERCVQGPGEGEFGNFYFAEFSTKWDLTKRCAQPTCSSRMVNRYILTRETGETGFNSCPTHREINAEVLWNGARAHVIMFPKAGAGRVARAYRRAESVEAVARLNRELVIVPN